MDLADAVEFDRQAVRRNIDAVRPGIPVFETSAKSGFGMDEALTWMTSFARAKTAGAV
jgi:hydrogenase nickel incorporation protein HypB